MAVVVQEVVGQRHDRRYYPLLSGVARSFHWYPIAPARPEDGVVDLALGLGKTIVDGGRCWSYSPSRPAAAPPYGSIAERVQGTQTTFWAIRLDRPPLYDPTVETEYLVELPLDAADYDDTLRHVASTYDAAADRLRPGTGREGPHVLDFAPILALETVPLNALLRDLLAVLEDELGTAVEMEFALSESRFGLVQVRPMVTPDEVVDVADSELGDRSAIVASERVLGNGVDPSIADVVYVPPERFDRMATRAIAREIAERNREIVAQGRSYVLIGFGRWGSVDPSLGIPVAWPDVGGARAIVESTLPQMDVEPSQGSHFFHNLSSFRVSYFMVHHAERPIDWGWLARQTVVAQTEHVRHVRTAVPLSVRVDGRTGRGVILAGGR
jgi:pyruvate phosphate dikinase-like enzyme